MTRMILNRCFFICLTFYCTQAHAQLFKNSALLDSVPQAGFYRIAVTPELSRLVKVDFSDLRIMDDKNNQVPFVLGNNIHEEWPDSLIELKIVGKTGNDSGKSTMIVENTRNEKTGVLYLKIKNTAVSRTLNLSGSDDRKSWFSIMENVNLGAPDIQSDVSFVENIFFPTSAYRYFKITMYNGKNDPLNVISVSKRSGPGQPETQPLLQNPFIPFAKKDSNRITYLVLNNKQSYHISNISVHIKGPRFFRRNVEVYSGNRQKGNFMISSDSLFNFKVPVLNDTSIAIIIYNEDNPSLEIGGISTAQTAEGIIAYLKPGVPYRLAMTSQDATTPQYDLVNFKDSIPSLLTEVRFSDIKSAAQANSKGNSGFFTKGWLWSILIIVLLVMGFFTFSLTRDVAKQSQSFKV